MSCYYFAKATLIARYFSTNWIGFTLNRFFSCKTMANGSKWLPRAKTTLHMI